MYRTLSNTKLVRELTREGVLFEIETEFNYPEIFKSRSCYKICDIFLYLSLLVQLILVPVAKRIMTATTVKEI